MVKPEHLRDLLYPPRCPICGRVTGERPLCPGCDCRSRRSLHIPYRLPDSEYSFCYIEGAASVYYYWSWAAEAIRCMKYSASPWRARGFGEVMARELFAPFGCTSQTKRDILKQNRAPGGELGYSCIVPVPSTRPGDEHIPGLLAAVLGRELGIPVTKALYKSRPTPRQEEMATREERLQNLWGSFSVCRGVDPEGKRILLVDDVITTGTTVSACAQALVYAGADSVFAVSIAAAGEKPPRPETE